MAYYRDLTGQFRQTRDYRDRFIDIFAEYDFACMDNECDFFCPECRKIMKCEAYREISDEWESFYM